MRIWKQAAISLLVLAVAGLLWARHLPAAAALLQRVGLPFGTAEAPADRPAMRGPAGGGPLVRGAEVVEAKVNDQVTAIGDGRAARSVTLTPYVAGRVAEIAVAAGDLVHAGQPILRLDSDAESIALDRARLVLEDARATLARNQRLKDSRAVSEVQLLEAELAVRQAELELRDAELAFDRRVVRAPFDGYLGILGVELGDQVSTATEVATLDDRSEILVDFRIPERFVGKVSAGMPASAVPLSSPGVALVGEVAAMDSRIDPGSRTLRVRARLDNSGDRLRAGMAFAITLRFPGDSFAAVDPLAIQWGAEGAYVWIGVDGRAERVPVRIVQRNDDAVLVDGALPAGTRVVIEGVQMLRPGAPLTFESDESAGLAARLTAG
ncbi:MAG TPA: efflux RND transporter periplasmic adaptor subunit [Amaricoccus sp.]|nr:efflux RND transporter periplasmic adaptor subunit [Amaricoccus sp.]